MNEMNKPNGNDDQNQCDKLYRQNNDVFWVVSVDQYNHPCGKHGVYDPVL
jgi:hypothetical protein